MNKLVMVFGFTIATLFIPTLIRAQVVINEVLPNPDSAFSSAEWIELYNDSDLSADVSNWTIQGKLIPANSVILPHNFLIITKSLLQFNQHYNPNNATYNVIQVAISLTNSGATLILNDNKSTQIDKVTYADSTNYRDRSWERINTANTTLQIHCYAHSLADMNSNVDNVSGQPRCPTIQFSLDNQTWHDQLEGVAPFDCYLALTDGQKFSAISWQVDNRTFTSTTTAINFPTSGNPAITATATIYGNTYKFTTAKLTLWPKLVINEIMPQDQYQLSWVEIFNPTTTPTDLTNWQMINNGITFKIPSITLAAGGYAAIDLPAGFLGDTLNQLQLVSPTNMSIDQLSFAAVPPPQSMSLVSTNNWTTEYPSSKGRINLPPQPITLQISEVYPSPNSGENEWIELFNYGDQNIDLSQWKLSDTTSQMYLTGNVAAQSYVVIDKPKITLNNSGDTIALIDPTGKEVDKVIYGSTSDGIAVARTLTGGKYVEVVVPTTIPTPGAINEFPTPVKPVEIPITKISDAKKQPLNSQIKISGFVSSPKDLFMLSEFYIEDESGGIKVDLASGISEEVVADLNMGLTITGELHSSSGELKIYVLNSADVVSTGINKVVSPADFAPLSLDANVGKLIKLNGVITHNYAQSFDIDSTSGVCRISKRNLEAADKAAANNKVEVTGIIIKQDDLCHLLPRFDSDINITLAGAVKSTTSKSAVNQPAPKTSASKLIYTLPDLAPKLSVQDPQLPLWQIAGGSGVLLAGCYALLSKRGYWS